MAFSYISDFEHMRLDAKVLPGTVIETCYLSDATTGQRRVPKIKAWKVERSLGQGGFGAVRLEVYGDEKRAVKRIWTTGSVLKNQYERELKALLEFSKPKYKEAAVFVEFFGWFEDIDSVYLTMEYLPLGDLEDNVPPEAGAIKEGEIKDIVSQILEGLKIMHSENFVHRDLKPKNILVCRPSPHWWVKLADFGLSKRKTEDTEYRTQTGTRAYMAPEMLNFVPSVDPESSEYTNSVDMWAMGCIVYRLVLGCVPFPLGPSLGKFCNDPSSLQLHELPLSPPGIKFIRDLLVPLPSARLTAHQALAHTWMTTKIDVSKSYDWISRALYQSNSELPASFGMYNTTPHAGLQSYGPSLPTISSHQGDTNDLNTQSHAQMKNLLSNDNLEAVATNGHEGRPFLDLLGALPKSTVHEEAANDDPKMKSKERQSAASGIKSLENLFPRTVTDPLVEGEIRDSSKKGKENDVLTPETVRQNTRSPYPPKNDLPAAVPPQERRRRRADRSKIASLADIRPPKKNDLPAAVPPQERQRHKADPAKVTSLADVRETPSMPSLSEPSQRSLNIQPFIRVVERPDLFPASVREGVDKESVFMRQRKEPPSKPGIQAAEEAIAALATSAGAKKKPVYVPLQREEPVSKPAKRRVRADLDMRLGREIEPDVIVRRRVRIRSRSPVSIPGRIYVGREPGVILERERSPYVNKRSNERQIPISNTRSNILRWLDGATENESSSSPSNSPSFNPLGVPFSRTLPLTPPPNPQEDIRGPSHFQDNELYKKIWVPKPYVAPTSQPQGAPPPPVPHKDYPPVPLLSELPDEKFGNPAPAPFRGYARVPLPHRKHTHGISKLRLLARFEEYNNSTVPKFDPLAQHRMERPARVGEARPYTPTLDGPSPPTKRDFKSQVKNDETDATRRSGAQHRPYSDSDEWPSDSETDSYPSFDDRDDRDEQQRQRAAKKIRGMGVKALLNMVAAVLGFRSLIRWTEDSESIDSLELE